MSRINQFTVLAAGIAVFNKPTR